MVHIGLLLELTVSPRLAFPIIYVAFHVNFCEVDLDSKLLVSLHIGDDSVDHAVKVDVHVKLEAHAMDRTASALEILDQVEDRI